MGGVKETSRRRANVKRKEKEEDKGITYRAAVWK